LLIPPGGAVDLESSGLLAAGVHKCGWEEFNESFVERFGLEKGHRAGILDDALPLLRRLHVVGVEAVFVGGSFVTAELLPGDFDVAYQAPAKNERAMWNDADLRRAADYDDDARARLRRQYSSDLWTTDGGIIRRVEGRPVKLPIVEAWQLTKPDASGDVRVKGIVNLDLTTLPQATSSESGIDDHK
jgi:hypothetical protein